MFVEIRVLHDGDRTINGDVINVERTFNEKRVTFITEIDGISEKSINEITDFINSTYDGAVIPFK